MCVLSTVFIPSICVVVVGIENQGKTTLVVRDTLAYSSYESTHKKLVVVWIRKPLAAPSPLFS